MKLTKKNYYSKEANDYYVSYSQLKSFHGCQAKCMAELNGEYEREDTTALLVGSYVDEYLNGSRSFGQFKIDNPQIFKKDGTLKSDFEQADKIIERIESDKVFRKLLRGRRQVIMTGVIMGVPVKIKIDSLHKDMIVDGKLMKDCEDIWSDEESTRVPFWRAYLYDWQAFIYQDIVRQNTGKKLPFVLAVATKQKGLRRHREVEAIGKAEAEDDGTYANPCLCADVHGLAAQHHAVLEIVVVGNDAYVGAYHHSVVDGDASSGHAGQRVIHKDTTAYLHLTGKVDLKRGH